MTRREHRRHAFLLIYQIPFIPSFNPDTAYALYLATFAENTQSSALDPNFVKTPLDGVYEHLSDIDSVIEENLTNWDIDRLSHIDLAILRLAVYELMYDDLIPSAVSVNEAVELAKLYGTDESASFVNGVLSGVVKQL